MISMVSIIFCVLTLLISLVLPVLVLVILAVRYKRQGILSAWLLGAGGFFATQLLIRLPILTALQKQDWFLAFAQNHLFAYSFSLAFTAGLFELAGRFAVAKILQKKLTCRRSLAAGLGHGGIEAMLLVGMTYVNNLICIFLINSGGFDSVIAQNAAAGLDISQLELIRTQLVSTPPLLFALAGLERILTMTAHVAMSMIVCYGVAHKKTIPCLLTCLGIHTLIDLTAGISLVLSQNIAYTVIYVFLIVMAVISLILIRKICRRWNKEVPHDSEK